MNLAVFAVAEERGGVFALAVDAENRGFLVKARAMVGAGGMGQVVFDRHNLDLLRVEAELDQAPLDALLVAGEAAIAGEDRIERTVRGVQVAPGIVPARLFHDADRRIGNGNGVNVGRLDAGELEAEFGGFVRHAVLRVLVAHEAFLFGGGDQLAVDVKRC